LKILSTSKTTALKSALIIRRNILKKQTVNTTVKAAPRPRGRPPAKKAVVASAAAVSNPPTYPVPESEGSPSKYHRRINGFWVDIYDVMYAFNIINPGDQSAITKIFNPSAAFLDTGNKNREDAIASLKRAIQLES
jgi:hypothetical protein